MIEQWRSEAPELPFDGMDVIARILRAAQHLDHEITRGLSAYGLSNREFDALSALRRSGPPYALTASELSHAILFSSGALTKLLERLQRAGLIVREQDREDRRVVRVALTEVGHKLQEEAMIFIVGQEDRLIAPFGERERKRLAQLLQTLLFNFELGDTRWPLRRRVVGGQPDRGEG
ncbi:MAG: MarR family transcriptional regulator [Solirubrobacteraceae bacterium]